MGKLVQFDNRGRVSRGSKVDPSVKAEILIFTGVRYERQTETPTKPTASSGGKRKRG